MKPIRIDITKQLRPLLKSVRAATRTAKNEAAKVINNSGQVLRDIESGKLSIVATLTVKKKK